MVNLEGKICDLQKQTDEVLVAMLKAGCKDAADVLLVRYHEWSDQLIARLARAAGVNEHDTQDASQDAVFAILRAIERYDNAKGCSFRTFLYRVVSDRFKDFVKRQRRARKWSGCCAEVDYHPNGANRYSSQEAKDDNPQWKAQWSEMRTMLGSFLDKLEAPTRDFLTALISGTSLRTAGESVGFSYDQAKRMRRKLQARLVDVLELQSAC